MVKGNFDANYFELLDFHYLAKIGDFKVDCLVLTLFLAPNLSSAAHTFGSKINEFERKKLEKIKKIQKPKNCRQLEGES